jgi:hypothetical protein
LVGPLLGEVVRGTDAGCHSVNERHVQLVIEGDVVIAVEPAISRERYVVLQLDNDRVIAIEPFVLPASPQDKP